MTPSTLMLRPDKGVSDLAGVCRAVDAVVDSVTISFRPLTVGDVSDVVRVLCAVEDPAMEDGFRRATLEQAQGLVSNSTTYVIRSDNHSVGRLRLLRVPGYIEIAGLQIHPNSQRRGIGTVVITAILDEAAHAGVPVELNVDRGNFGAQRLYARLGFRRIGAVDSDYRMRHDPQIGKT